MTKTSPNDSRKKKITRKRIGLHGGGKVPLSVDQRWSREKPGVLADEEQLKMKQERREEE